MKMSTTIAGMARNARLAAVGGVAAILVSVAVSACGGSTPSAGPSFSPGGTVTPTETGTPTSTGTPTTTASPDQSATPTPTESSLPPSPTPSSSPSPFPTVAPATGGGGTAGFQDGLLLAVGAAAILAGAGSLAYRRRLLRNRQ
jgi:hypothetical protein